MHVCITCMCESNTEIMCIYVFWFAGWSSVTAILIIIEGQVQVFQRFSSSKLVLKAVGSRFEALNYYENGRKTQFLECWKKKRFNSAFWFQKWTWVFLTWNFFLSGKKKTVIMKVRVCALSCRPYLSSKIHRINVNGDFKDFIHDSIDRFWVHSVTDHCDNKVHHVDAQVSKMCMNIRWLPLYSGSQRICTIVQK